MKDGFAVQAQQSGLKLTLMQRSFSSFRPAEWDNFARAGGGSFLGLWRVVNVHRFCGRVRLFDFLLADGTYTQKVGQCAVRISKRKVAFLDRIHLLVGYEHLNRGCLDLITQQCGHVMYRYGSHWNNESHFDLSSLQHFDVSKNFFHIDVIDFNDWADYTAYFRAVSENIRRDYKKAREAAPVVKINRGIRALRDLPALMAMRRQMIRRNKLSSSRVLDFLLHAAKLVALGQNGLVVTAKIRGTCYAAFFGAQVGNRLYYISGGTRSNRLGVGSYLFLTLIEHWFSQHSNGQLLMGDCSTLPDSPMHDCGSLLYRRKLRVRSVNGVEFELMPKPFAHDTPTGKQAWQETARPGPRVPQHAAYRGRVSWTEACGSPIRYTLH